jgi:hypothetical protein
MLSGEERFRQFRHGGAVRWSIFLPKEVDLLTKIKVLKEKIRHSEAMVSGCVFGRAR